MIPVQYFKQQNPNQEQMHPSKMVRENQKQSQQDGHHLQPNLSVNRPTLAQFSDQGGIPKKRKLPDDLWKSCAQQAKNIAETSDKATDTKSSSQKDSRLLDEEDESDRTIEYYRQQYDQLQKIHQLQCKKNEASRETVKRLLVEINTSERKALRDKTDADSRRLGHFKVTSLGDITREKWTFGRAFDELDKRNEQIDVERDEISQAQTTLKSKKQIQNGKLTMFAQSEKILENQLQENLELEEIHKIRKDQLKKEEAKIELERDQLEREKLCHSKELKRASNENDSKFKNHCILGERYLMLKLLLKGGFSEVWKSFDLEENRYVACKIHHVNTEWTDAKQASYVMHANRENNIHKSLDHCRIVKQYDLIILDRLTICTVQEFVSGNDLDLYLKQNKSMTEKETRSIIMQVVSALVYLNERNPPIIHYDLKPANILLETGSNIGAVKLTDFGLSKLMIGEDDEQVSGIELTSQFSGTYWYLPPETFFVPPPMITCKVDVWSVGVIFYECIYGKKPFGNDMTQRQILKNKVIINAREISFPSKPHISLVAQNFIRRCLQYRVEDRADVFELAKHELFKTKGSTRTS